MIENLSKYKKISLIENREQKQELDETPPMKSNKLNLLYGNDISIKKPREIGNMLAFVYYSDNPLIVIGKDCKFFLIISNNRYKKFVDCYFILFNISIFCFLYNE